LKYKYTVLYKYIYLIIILYFKYIYRVIVFSYSFEVSYSSQVLDTVQVSYYYSILEQYNIAIVLL